MIVKVLFLLDGIICIKYGYEFLLENVELVVLMLMVGIFWIIVMC